jgi:very-short-patch-repair endonuclease
VVAAPPSSALRAPSPIEGEGPTENFSASSPSPLMGEGGRSPDEGGAATAIPAADPAVKLARLRGFARDMRKSATPHEGRLWGLLRDRRLESFKFRRQVPIGPFIADFVCFDRRLIVELDGGQHGENPSDVTRDAELARRGFRVLRIWNGDLTRNRNGVLEAIYAALEDGTPPSSGLRPPSPIKGEGDGTANSAVGPSPLMGEDGRSPDEGGATRTGGQA